MEPHTDHRRALFGDVRTPECHDIVRERKGRRRKSWLNNAMMSREKTTTLTEEDVREICQLWFSEGNPGLTGRDAHAFRGNVTQVQLAEIFGVTHGAISKIVNGRTWKHLDIPCRDEYLDGA